MIRIVSIAALLCLLVLVLYLPSAHPPERFLAQIRSEYQAIEEMIPADVLGKLPNLQYFASVSGGRIIKGRFPILDPDFDRPAASLAASRP